MLLLLGRAIAGITSANILVATAYITDISSEEKRTQRFGLFNAMFGIGFIIGPVLGGVFGNYWVRLPFLAAALLSAFNLLLAFCILPLVFIFLLFGSTGEAYGTCWVLWGGDTFHWNGFWIGLSLGAFGACQALAQAFLPAVAVRLLGENATILTGITCVCIALIVIAFATQTWMVFAIMPVFAVVGIFIQAAKS